MNIHWCLSTYETFLIKLSPVRGVVHELRSRKVNEKYLLIVVNVVRKE